MNKVVGIEDRVQERFSRFCKEKKFIRCRKLSAIITDFLDKENFEIREPEGERNG